jgi:hypothetical protein
LLVLWSFDFRYAAGLGRGQADCVEGVAVHGFSPEIRVFS